MQASRRCTSRRSHQKQPTCLARPGVIRGLPCRFEPSSKPLSSCQAQAAAQIAVTLQRLGMRRIGVPEPSLCHRVRSRDAEAVNCRNTVHGASLACFLQGLAEQCNSCPGQPKSDALAYVASLSVVRLRPTSESSLDRKMSHEQRVRHGVLPEVFGDKAIRRSRLCF